MAKLSGLYAITQPFPTRELLVATVEQAISGGARIIQYRDKSGDHSRRLAEATALLALCRTHAVPLIINDDMTLAAEVGADGVHLGRDDGALEAARRRLGPACLIGVSCYASIERARTAVAQGANYVAFGRFFPSHSKPGAPPAPLSVLRAAAAELTVPVVAIGGITPDNGGPLLAAGAHLLAAIDGVFGQPDPAAAARRYQQLFEQHQGSQRGHT